MKARDCADWSINTAAKAVIGHFGHKTLRHQDISVLVSGHFGTNAWTLRHYSRTTLRQYAQTCNRETTFKDTQGHRYYIGVRGSPKVTGSVTTR